MHSHDHSHNNEKRSVALASMGASALLTIIKFGAAVFTGSLGLLSEAIHSLIDLGATTITWFAVRWADEPADDKHHFGHAKIESVAALFETLLLLATAIYVAYEAVMRLISGHSEITITWWAIAIVIISIVIDLNRSRALSKTAKRTESEALAADAAHFESDMWSSGAVLVGLLGVWMGFPWADALAALLVSGLIAVIAINLGRNTLSTLLDTVPDGMTAEIRKIAETTDGVLAVNQLRVKPAGPKFFISLVIEISRMIPVLDVESLKERLSAAITKAHPRAELTITANPVTLDSETVFEKIALIANHRSQSVHHVTVQNIDGKLAVSFDLELDGATPLLQAHEQATKLEDAIRNSLGGNIEVESHIEPLPLRQLDGKPAPAKTADTIGKALHKLVKPASGMTDLHNIRVRLTDGGLFVHYHCRFSPTQTIEDVHTKIDRIENELKAQFKTISRVVAHAEPVGLERHKL